MFRAQYLSHPTGADLTSYQRRGPLGHGATMTARPKPLKFREIGAGDVELMGPDPWPNRQLVRIFSTTFDLNGGNYPKG